MASVEAALRLLGRLKFGTPLLTASTPVVDVTGAQPVEHRGRVPSHAVVIPGTRMKRFAAGEFGVATGLIIGWRSEKQDRRVSLNDALRDFDVST